VPPAGQHPEQTETRPHVPVAAARLADVPVGHPHPAVRGGVGQRGLHQQAVRLLGLEPLRQLAAGLGEPVRKRVAQQLELAQREQRRRTAGHRPPRQARARPRRGAVVHELTLEPGDLAAQLAPRAGLVRRGAGARSGGALGDHPPIGARGLEPQKTCVPTMPTTCTSTVLSTIDFAVAVPTPTGPPEAL
jgi:hypothetical protein